MFWLDADLDNSLGFLSQGIGDLLPGSSRTGRNPGKPKIKIKDEMHNISF